MYRRETVIAEKFQAMTELGPINSRLKDFYDIWLLSRQFTFEGPLLADAISRTFEKRGTQVDPSPVALSVGFLTDNMRQRQWAGFLKRSALGDAPPRCTRYVDRCEPFCCQSEARSLNGKPSINDGHPPTDGPQRNRARSGGVLGVRAPLRETEVPVVRPYIVDLAQTVVGRRTRSTSREHHEH